ncbi:MAG: hypothetical protein HOK52_14420 [Candidatus Marinimicrobia bacterium]|jgi:hypothetical protein|nr:hypothetical protein [Candidatus Neomarinimicrobiota bacterium]MBT3936167.1 hypothetical protein [Candidatus Neomarinimicrobiota bacterium]MBT3960400.1 hypothetical protein [Candidatus Neomarinimicrobiota bacterium]MBT4635213.1 hypothetical protein [Candidatus Neomarinimicrobiota bacterium]MBT4684291.1 hypothetical protein [Candidatus Neomarinimicrobiota bacterium]|tara:strand:+ start:54 stop:329 length:276 start_codon:yes stop_codon:yes gene_type:complete
MALRTIPFRDIEEKTENMYEAVAAMSSQAKRILYERVVDATLKNTENDEFGVFDEVEEPSPEEYVELEKPTTIAVDQFLDGNYTWNRPITE